MTSRSSDWLESAVDGLRTAGYAVVPGVIDQQMLSWTHEAMYRVQREIVNEVGQERLDRAGELGVLRLMCAIDERFLTYSSCRSCWPSSMPPCPQLRSSTFRTASFCRRLPPASRPGFFKPATTRISPAC